MIASMFPILLIVATSYVSDIAYNEEYSKKSSSSNMMFSASSEPEVRSLSIASIYNVRNMNLVTNQIDMSKYANDVLLHKLDPIKICDHSEPVDYYHNPLARYDTKDLQLFPLATRECSKEVD